ncbi:MAG: putative zinc-binding protein [Candidatus Ratteibacteria bacterium]
MKKKCCCGGPSILLFPCAGGSDVGALTDRVARKLTQDGWGRIYCLAGVAAHLSSLLESAKAAKKVVAIDGCPTLCATKALIHAGFQPIGISLKELGFMKGNSPISEENINKICDWIKNHSPIENDDSKKSGVRYKIDCCGNPDKETK